MTKPAKLVCPDCNTEAVVVLNRRICPDCREDLVVNANTWEGAPLTVAPPRWVYTQKRHDSRGGIEWTGR